MDEQQGIQEGVYYDPVSGENGWNYVRCVGGRTMLYLPHDYTGRCVALVAARTELLRMANNERRSI